MNNELIVDVGNITENIKKVRRTRKSIIFVVKGCVYGVGYELLPYVDKLVDSFAVSSVAEANKVRSISNKNVLILSPVLSKDIEMIDDFIYSITSIEQLIHYKKNSISKLKICIKLNTGLNRFGIGCNDIDEILKKCFELDFDIVGVYTHMANSTSNDVLSTDTEDQYGRYMICVNQIKEKFPNIETHYSDSSVLVKGSIRVKDVSSIRTGMFILGMDPIPSISNKFSNPYFVLSFNMVVLDKHAIKCGEFYGYEKRTRRDIYTCTIGIGYCDGMKKAWVGNDLVSFESNNLKILDISMNTSIIEVSKRQFKQIQCMQTKLNLFSNQKELNELAVVANTSIEDIVSGLNSINNSIRYD
jgi:alanine racemase